MPEDKKYKYRLTKEGRQDVKTRAKSEAGLEANKRTTSGVRSKLGQKITGKRYKIAKTGSGSKGDQEKTMVKPKSVAYGHRKFEGKEEAKTGQSKKTESFDTKASSESSYKERIGGKYKKIGKETPKQKESTSSFYKKTSEAADNKKAEDEGKGGKYKKGSRTEEQTDKTRTLKRRLETLKSEKGEKGGKKAMYRERKRFYKDEYKKSGYLQ